MIAPTCAPGVRRWRGGFRDGGPVPYERTGDWAGLLRSSAQTEDRKKGVPGGTPFLGF